jgi:hypothetical protein
VPGCGERVALHHDQATNDAIVAALRENGAV